MRERIFALFCIFLLSLCFTTPMANAFDESCGCLDNGIAGCRGITIKVKILLDDSDPAMEIGLRIGEETYETSTFSEKVRSGAHLIKELAVKILRS